MEKSKANPFLLKG